MKQDGVILVRCKLIFNSDKNDKTHGVAIVVDKYFGRAVAGLMPIPGKITMIIEETIYGKMKVTF